MSRKKGRKRKLTLKQALFCQHYVLPEFHGNGGKAYAKVYGLDLANPRENLVARVNASRLLKNANIKSKIKFLLQRMDMMKMVLMMVENRHGTLKRIYFEG
jgi:hypothetical protein